MKKFIDIHSLNYDTIDEIIKRFKGYKKDFGGSTIFTQDIAKEYSDYGELYTAIYQGFSIKEEDEDANRT